MASSGFLKLRLAGPLLVGALLFTRQCSAGYKLDDDCKRQPLRMNPTTVLTTYVSLGSDLQKEFLTQGFQSANTLALLAQSNLNGGLMSDAGQVYEWLYGSKDNELINQGVGTTIDGIIANSSPLDGEPLGGAPESTDVRVYCTMDRLKEANDRMFDSNIKQFLKAKLDCATAMAWTYAPGGSDARNPDTLQLCPWFLDYAMKQNAQFQNQFTSGKMASMITHLKLDRLATWVLYTPVDLFQLFDKILVHELSHTRRASQLEDVGGFSGYGWKNCRKLSTGTDPTPDRNADTIALFASISGLIGSGGMVNEDGSFTRGGDGNNEGDQPAEAGEQAKRSVVPASGRTLKKRSSWSNPWDLKGRPLF